MVNHATTRSVITQLIRESEAAVKRIRADLELEERFLERLKARYTGRDDESGEREEDANKNGPDRLAPTGTLPEAIAEVLRKNGKPMRARDIAETLLENGYESEAKHGLLPSVLSALGRRQDLFVKVHRGVYSLRYSAEQQRE